MLCAGGRQARKPPSAAAPRAGARRVWGLGVGRRVSVPRHERRRHGQRRRVPQRPLRPRHRPPRVAPDHPKGHAPPGAKGRPHRLRRGAPDTRLRRPDAGRAAERAPGVQPRPGDVAASAAQGLQPFPEERPRLLRGQPGKTTQQPLSHLIFPRRHPDWSIPTGGQNLQPRCPLASHQLPLDVPLQGKKMVIFGGFDGNQPLHDLYILDTTTYRWMQIDLPGGHPLGRSGSACAMMGSSRMYMMGGYSKVQCRFRWDEGVKGGGRGQLFRSGIVTQCMNAAASRCPKPSTLKSPKPIFQILILSSYPNKNRETLNGPTGHALSGLVRTDFIASLRRCFPFLVSLGSSGTCMPWTWRSERCTASSSPEGPTRRRSSRSGSRLQRGSIRRASLWRCSGTVLAPRAASSASRGRQTWPTSPTPTT